MNLADLQPKQIYLCKVSYETSTNEYCNALIYVWSTESQILDHEIIAIEKNIDPDECTFLNESIFRQIQILNLPLYVHYQYKTITFERLIRGSRPYRAKKRLEPPVVMMNP